MLKAAAAEVNHLETAFRRMAQKNILFMNEEKHERISRYQLSSVPYLRLEIAMNNPVIAHDLQ
jgi:hypothetical protein